MLARDYSQNTSKSDFLMLSESFVEFFYKLNNCVNLHDNKIDCTIKY